MDSERTATLVLKRYEAMEKRRSPWTSVWLELTRYFLPCKSGGFSEGVGPGQAGDDHIFDSTPADALELLASALGGLLTNPGIPWFEVRHRDRRLGEDSRYKDFFTRSQEVMRRVFNSEDTGFQTYAHELYLDVALLGTAVMYVEADAESKVRFSTRSLGECSIAENVRGQVDTVFRRYVLSARQMMQNWGKDCSEAVREAAEDRPDTTFEVLHAVYPRTDRDPEGIGAKDFPYASVYLEKDTGHVLEESGYVELPYMVPRWSKAAGEIYGRGPGLTALSDTRVLNAMGKTALLAAEKMSDPPLLVPDDGFLGPIRSGPGGLSYYRAGTGDRIEPLPVQADLRATMEMMQQRRDSIRKILMGDIFAPADGPAITATEAVIRQSERMRVLGPVLGRMQVEFLGPMVRRVFGILLRGGLLPPMPEGLSEEDVEVRYTSTLSRSQKLTEAQAFGQVVSYIAPLVGKSDPFGVMDNFDPDRITRHAVDLFGAPAEYLRDEDEVEKRRNAKHEAAREQAETDRMQQGAEVAKKLGDAKMGDSSVLEMALGGRT